MAWAPMSVRKPHFLLYCDATVRASSSSAGNARCKWRCVVDDLNEQSRVEITDNEQDSSPERSSLIAVVRGLEALEQPSQVTLVTSSPYVNKGLRYGLKEWRENNYQWEHFGSEKPVRNADLWRRVDQAMQFHQVDCRLIEAQAGVAIDTNDEAEDKATVKQFRLDDAHLTTEAANTNAVVKSEPSYALRIAISIARKVGLIIGGMITVPEKTIYAIESLIDVALDVVHQCAAPGPALRRARGA